MTTFCSSPPTASQWFGDKFVKSHELSFCLAPSKLFMLHRNSRLCKGNFVIFFYDSFWMWEGLTLVVYHYYLLLLCWTAAECTSGCSQNCRIVQVGKTWDHWVQPFPSTATTAPCPQITPQKGVHLSQIFLVGYQMEPISFQMQICLLV